MLEVFKREGVENVVCVVTRYFGGVLLGTDVYKRQGKYGFVGNFDTGPPEITVSVGASIRLRISFDALFKQLHAASDVLFVYDVGLSLIHISYLRIWYSGQITQS